MNIQDDIAWLKQQLIELQSQQAFQEDTVQALNDVVSSQQQQIERLNELYQHTTAQLALLIEESGIVEGRQERPPHY